MNTILRSIAKCFQPLVLTFASVLVFASAANAAVVTQWTFETSVPATAGPHAAEVGTGSASSNSGTGYSNPVGNGSGESFSSTGWNSGDYFEFSSSAAGYQNISVSWDQTASSTGPRDFALLYSTNGTTFSNVFSYAVLQNLATPTGPGLWNSATAISAYSFSPAVDLSALANAASVYFRLVDTSTTSTSGGTVGTGGTNRVDNFKISGDLIPPPTVVPEASALLVWSIICGSVLVGWKRCR